VAVDLHLHSTTSDGTDTPSVVIGHAAAAGLTAVALTDHDTLEGLAEAAAAAERLGIGLVPGVELSLEWPLGGMHLLVYHLEPGPGPLQDRLASLQLGREQRNLEVVERLTAFGWPITIEDIVEESGGGVVGRPHIAAVLVRIGAADSIADAFDRWLARGRPGYVDRVRLSPDEAIGLARRSGAVPVLAHPHTTGVSADDYERTFAELAGMGLAGIEAWYAEYPDELRRHIAALAGGLGLIATGGSDYHGTYKPGLSVGSGHGDLVVPDDVVAAIAALAR
jgi:3',5'-nucleoside bisphosphate phosphatase